MDQNHGGLHRLQALQSAQDRLLACRATRNRGEGGKAGTGRVIQCPVVVMDHDTHRANLGMTCKSLEAMAQHRLAGELDILLGRCSAETAAPAGGDDQCDGMDELHCRRSLAGNCRDDH